MWVQVSLFRPRESDFVSGPSSRKGLLKEVWWGVQGGSPIVVRFPVPHGEGAGQGSIGKVGLKVVNEVATLVKIGLKVVSEVKRSA